MKTPISYYGGKQKLASKIISLIPKKEKEYAQTLYCEPFFGDGAIFFGKEPHKVEVINDTNKELINFYRVVQSDFVSLEKEIRITLHSRTLHRDATTINNSPHLFSEVKRAWAVWVLAAQSFASKLNGPWGYDLSGNTTSKKVANKRNSFTEDYAIRLQNVQIECADALRIIVSRDTENSFFYCDPPYYNSDMGHYDGYTKEDFERLLQTLANIRGKFLLSSYPSELLAEYAEKHGWKQIAIEQLVSINPEKKRTKKKVEMLTMNYEPFEGLPFESA